MKYTKKAFLTAGEPPRGAGSDRSVQSGGWGIWSDPDAAKYEKKDGVTRRVGGSLYTPLEELGIFPQRGGASDPEMKQLLQTMAVRQMEQSTPYTQPLLTLKGDLDVLMTTKDMDVTEKLSQLRSKMGQFVEMMRRSRASSAPGATPAVKPAVAKKPAVTPFVPKPPKASPGPSGLTSTPLKAPIDSKRRVQEELAALYKAEAQREALEAKQAKALAFRPDWNSPQTRSKAELRRLAREAQAAKKLLKKQQKKSKGKGPMQGTGRPAWTKLRFRRD